MKTAENVLYPNAIVGTKVTNYADSHTLGLPKEITDYHAWICETQERANYCISTFQGKSLVWLARLAGAKRGKSKSIATIQMTYERRIHVLMLLLVLEVGCYLGFSAAVWSFAVGPEGSVTGLEYSEEYAQTARSKLDGLGIKNVEFKVGPASER
jgi:hypothetical protein